MNFKKLIYSIILPALFVLFSNTLSAQSKTVSGRVLDASGSGLQGVTVSARGTNLATVTNELGQFSLTVPQATSVLVFSYVGHTTQEVSIAGAVSELTVNLEVSTGTMSEVVVIGYGTARRGDVTGSVSTVTSKDFVRGPITSPEQLISGKIAGVQISTNGGAPGTGSRIRIRGGSSLNATNDPLIVIDGVPVEGGVAGSSNALNLINPNDIESFTVLKDPSAAAIYGSRASNGVILITTKKGNRGPVKFNFQAQTFAQVPGKKVDVLSADEIRSLVASTGNADDLAKLGTANTDWQDEIFRTAWGQDFNLSASGAALDGRLPFRISGGYLNQDGILRTGNFQRQSLGLNLSPKLLNDNLGIELNAKGARTTNKFANEGAIGSAVAFDPTQPVRVNSDRFGGFFEYVEASGTRAPRDLAPRNPVALLEMRDNNSEVYRLLGNIQFNYQIPFVKGLRANLNLGYDHQAGEGTDRTVDSAASEYRRWEVVKTASGRDSVVHFGGVNNEYRSKQRNKLLDFYLNYAYDFGSNSKVDLMAGYGYQDFLYTNYNFPDRRFDRSILPNTEPQFPISDPGFTLISYYSRINFNVANKYILTLNGRFDGSSKFNSNDRWGFFPSAAVAWKISEEDFLRNSTTISDLKFRIGYGVTGQQGGIDLYGYIPRYTISNNRAQYQLGNEFFNMYRPSAYDPNLTWETTRNLNFGIDYGFFNNRINGSLDYFDRETENLLSVVPIPLGTNFSNTLLTNVGNIESKGFEFTINTVPVRRSDFNLEVGFNFTYVDPKISKLLLNPDPSFQGNRFGGFGGGTGNTIQIHSVGFQPSSFFVYKQVYDFNGNPIDGLYEDLNRDGIINDEDLYRYMAADPRFFMGLSSNFNYKKWSGGFVLRGSVDNYLYNAVASNIGVRRGIINPLGWINNGSRDFLNTSFENNQYFSDYYVQNASFARMDNINLGYHVGEVFKGANLTISANVQNAFVITKYTGLDPEFNGGIDNTFYPRPRTYTLGINLGF